MPDCDRWRAAFDADPLDRIGSGVRGYRVLRPVDDPRHVLIDLEFDTAAEATDMHERLRGLWAGPARAVVIAPTARTVEVVDAGGL